MKKPYRGGFTLVELALSMIFVGLLSVTVTLLIQNITASYRRGLVLNQINTVGMDLIDDFRSSVQNASSDPIGRMCEAFYASDGFATTDYDKCMGDKGGSFVLATRYAAVTVDGKNLGTMPVFGAFCTGTYTYIWNSGYFEGTELSTRIVNGASAAVVGTKTNATSFSAKYSGFRLLKIYDDERSICVNTMKTVASAMGKSGQYVSGYSLPGNSYFSYNNRVSNQFVIDSVQLSDAEANGDNVEELLKRDTASDLVLYDLYIATPALSSTRQNMFYSGTFILGTRRGGVNVTTAGNSCKPPEDWDSQLEYCAINKFNFAVQAGG